MDGTTTTYTYDRNRLLKASVGGTGFDYNYDPFGRLDRVTSGGIQVEKNKYDGFDRIKEQSSLQADGSSKKTSYTYDPLDRTTSRTEGSKTTDFNYLGLSEEVFSEEVVGKIQKSYQYSPWGERLSMVKHKSDGTAEDSYYGYNPHTDVEVLTDEKGDTRATYGYTAYGKADEKEFTGVDKPDPQTPDQEPYNVYGFNSKRWDAGSGLYDMGFRDYDPGLNRFLTRDMYNGALADMNLGMDPWNNNRYAFAGGNPISGVKLDGHIAPAIPLLAYGVMGIGLAYYGGKTVEATAEVIQEEGPGLWEGAKQTTKDILGGIAAAFTAITGTEAVKEKRKRDEDDTEKFYRTMSEKEFQKWLRIEGD